MKNENNINTLHKWVACHVAHDIDGMLEFLTDDISITSAAGGKMPPASNKEEAAHHWQTIYDAFPDMKMETISVLSQDNTLFVEISHGGTMEGAMGPMQPTGKSYRLEGAFKFNFEDGKIRSIRSYWDPGSMMMQLGLIPEMA